MYKKINKYFNIFLTDIEYNYEDEIDIAKNKTITNKMIKILAKFTIVEIIKIKYANTLYLLYNNDLLFMLNLKQLLQSKYYKQKLYISYSLIYNTKFYNIIRSYRDNLNIED